MGPCIAYCLCSRVGSVAVAVPAPTILCFAPLSIVTAPELFAPFMCYNRKAEVEQEPQKIKQGRNLKSCAFTRMAQQHHQESLSQLF